MGTNPLMQIREFPNSATSSAGIVVHKCQLLAVGKRLNYACLSGFKMQAVTWVMLCLCSVGKWVFLSGTFLVSDSWHFVFLFLAFILQ